MKWFSAILRLFSAKLGDKPYAVPSATRVRASAETDLDWDRLWETYREEGYESLSDAELVWLNTRSFIDAVNNGGIVSYFYNNNAEHYDDAVEALETLDVPEIRLVLTTIGDLFGDEVPSDIDRRNELIRSWGGGEESKMMDKADEYLYTVFDELEERLDEYLVSNGLDPRTYLE